MWYFLLHDESDLLSNQVTASFLVQLKFLFQQNYVLISH